MNIDSGDTTAAPSAPRRATPPHPRTIGLLGGMSFESTALYYRLINEDVRGRLGGVHSARLLLHSLDFEDVIELQRSGNWAGAAELLGDAAEGLQRAGADLLLICTNTMHKVAREVQERVPVPLVDIIDVTARRARELGLRLVGLAGTAYTMQDGFYAERLAEHGVEVLLPEPDDRRFLQRLIFEELSAGHFTAASRRELERVIDRLAGSGAEATILGCTELELLYRERDGVVVLPTAELHARAAVDAALAPRRGFVPALSKAWLG